MNPKVKGVLVYHEWGFPQKMDEILKFCKDNNLFCIEDCAHTFSSYYEGKRLGTFGNAAVFSLAKFFPSVVGGAVYSKNKEILEFVKNAQSHHKSSFADEAFQQRVAFDSNPDDENKQIKLRQSYAVYDELYCCPDYSLNVVKEQLENGAIEKRQANFQIFKEAFGNGKYEKDLFKENVLPWVAPLFFSESSNRRVAEALKNKNIESGVYHFDVNRNVLKPDFKECVIVPCHQGIPEKKILEIVEIIRKAV
jgi:dTDP-4-amino-4,6-dideoxygalactose transaminase